MSKPLNLHLKLFITSTLAAGFSCGQPGTVQVSRPGPTAPTAKATVLFQEVLEKPEPRTVALLKNQNVYIAPDRKAERIGVVMSGTRVLVTNNLTAGDCEDEWLELAPRGWMCAKTAPTSGPLSTEVLPILDRGLVPGTYGKVRSDAMLYENRKQILLGEGRSAQSDLVSMMRTEEIDGETYWFTHDHEYVLASDVIPTFGSAFAGISLDETMTLPLLFAFSPDRRSQQISIYAAPQKGAAVVRKVPLRSALPVLGMSPDGAFARVGDNQWVAKKDARIAQRTPAPDLDSQEETWVDVDLDAQTLVLYRGEQPIYATLVSSGRKLFQTPTGTYRVVRKKATTTMKSDPDDPEQYTAQRVPWTLYFHQGFALHGAYWHDNFGRQKSHGCVNLAPADARVVYGALGPDVPPGWNELAASHEHPGSIVRIRDVKDPDPPFRGYARDLADAKKKLASR